MIATRDQIETQATRPAVIIRRFSDDGVWGYRAVMDIGTEFDIEVDRVSYDMKWCGRASFRSTVKALRKCIERKVEAYTDHFRVPVYYESSLTPKRTKARFILN